MADKVGRNDPCPCGSGKKYKKCCAQSNIVEFSSQVVVQEMDQHWKSLMEYVFEFHPDLVFYESATDEVEQVRQVMKMLYWASVIEKSGQTAMEGFVDHMLPKVNRPMTKSALKDWKHSKPSIFKVEHVQSEEVVEMLDLFTHDRLEVRRGCIPVDNISQDLYVIGFALSWGPQYQIMPIAYPATKSHYHQILNEISDHNEFVERFLDLMDLWFSELEFDALELLQNDKAKRVVEILRGHMSEKEKQKTTYDNLEVAWVDFYEKNLPRIQKPEVLAATLEYLYWTSPMFGLQDESVTMKELAKKYGVNSNSISNRVYEIEDYLFERFHDINANEDVASGPTLKHFSKPGWDVASERMMYEMNKKASSQTFNDENELNEFLNKTKDAPYTPKNDEERAQLLAFEAHEEMEPSIVDQVLQLDPENIDGLVLKAFFSDDLDESEELLKKGIEVGKEKLDLAELAELEHPWAMIEVRPWLRAYQALAELYNDTDRPVNAIECYEAIMEWNFNDNQGIRYRLFPLYIAMYELPAAKSLLDIYPADDAFHFFNEALYELVQENGKLTQTVKELLRIADNRNPYIIPMLTGKLPILSIMPKMFEQGSPDEAVVYCHFNESVWIDYLDALEDVETVYS
ncbi:SEC-C metal-binding domain-containing protein [Alkalibacillus haloalkaliphilus]|uniref:SEC-C motif-containing protein n=1 Tax=Alkalibacillus haloalkaliphilus TaxID=94136 RepID=A0A511W7C1_9BACI|nr:SEC-C metal-binding domain-containing protein [Alkalibacillus haloalkaliphilus]GEN46631.1 hypothetical protein AHA02nite_24070 [Alkalibacillus haloalkaliphilus]